MATDKMLYHLPYNDQTKLCKILDSNSTWEILAEKYMRYDVFTIESLRQKNHRNISPTEELLGMWGSLNHSVIELFCLLYKMQQFQAMEVIKQHVDEDYHYLVINHDEEAHGEPIVENEDNFNSVQTLQHPVAETGRFSTTNPTLVSGSSHVVESVRSIPERPYEEIERSAYHWDPRRLLGRGGFATVWCGVWKCTQVAIKRIEPKQNNNTESHNNKIKQFFMELHYMNFYRHDNILPVYGFNGHQLCFLYQYMPGGSLEYRLRTQDPSKILNWSKRLNIAVGAARGLQFLHTSHIPLIHNDIKSANILLDSNDNAKIGDFGLAREGPRSNNEYINVSKAQGTRAYLPSDYLQTLKASTKIDTYSFGIVLFEIATGLCAHSNNRKNKYLKDHVINYEGNIYDLEDARIEKSDTCYKDLIDIGTKCVRSISKDRPDMVTVLISLEKITL